MHANGWCSRISVCVLGLFPHSINGMAPISAHLLQTNDVMHSTLCTQQFLSAHLLQTEIFTRTPWHRQTHTHRFLRQEVFTQKGTDGPNLHGLLLFETLSFFLGGPLLPSHLDTDDASKSGRNPHTKGKKPHAKLYFVRFLCSSHLQSECVFGKLRFRVAAIYFLFIHEKHSTHF